MDKDDSGQNTFVRPHFGTATRVTKSNDYVPKVMRNATSGQQKPTALLEHFVRKRQNDLVILNS